MLPDREEKSTRTAAFMVDLSRDHPASPVRSIVYHPVVAVSLILMAASLAQILVWRMHVGYTPQPVSSFIAHGMLYEGIEGVMAQRANPSTNGPSAMFALCLFLALSSAFTWYIVAWTALGRAWALWIGLFWVTHPAFAFLVQRPGAHAFLVALVPACLALLVGWRARPRVWLELLLGLATAIMLFVSLQAVIVLVVTLAGMLACGAPPRRRLQGALTTSLGFALFVFLGLSLLVPWFLRHHDIKVASVFTDRAMIERRAPIGLAACWARADRWPIEQRFGLAAADAALVSDRMASKLGRRMNVHLWKAFDTSDGTRLAHAARKETGPLSEGRESSALKTLAAELRTHPGSTLTWLGQRARSTLYTTANRSFKWPLLTLQLVWLVPALWGALVASTRREERWLAVIAATLVASLWIMAAVAEPLTRNLTPVGGFAVIFAAMGVVDIHRRIFGQRAKAAPAAPRSSVHARGAAHRR